MEGRERENECVRKKDREIESLAPHSVTKIDIKMGNNTRKKITKIE
jgi:hypothetical protein